MRTISNDRATVHILPDSLALAQAAANTIKRAARIAIEERQKFTLALSGGSTPKAIFQLLAQEHAADVERIEWDKVHVFFGDERCVPADHPESNFRMAHEILLSKVPAPSANIHRIHTELGPVAAAQAYEKTLNSVCRPDRGQLPSLDLVMLGMGTDGHTASLFPETGALDERQSSVVANWVPKLNTHRVTFTYPLINSAKEILFISGGAEKAGMLRNVLRGHSGTTRYPSEEIRPTGGKLVWMIDEPASTLL